MTPLQIASLVIVALSLALSIHVELRARRIEKRRREMPLRIAEERRREAEERQRRDAADRENPST